MSIALFPNAKFRDWYWAQPPSDRAVIDATIESTHTGPEPTRPSYRYADRKWVIDICAEYFGYAP
jgi:hypothetical protein